MDKMSPTPTPWEWDSGIIPPDGPGTYCDIYVDGGDTLIAEINDCIPQGLANAALIIEAVNSHAALKARITELEANERKAAEHIRGLEEALRRIASYQECPGAGKIARTALSHAGPVARDGER